jgi:glycosyltransferase involved in cell wall biosynthesis
MRQVIRDESSTDQTETCVYVDGAPLCCPRFTGTARYTARLALALSAHAPVRLLFQGEVSRVSPSPRFSQDHDLARWARRVLSSAREPLGTPSASSLVVYPVLRPAQRLFPYEVSVLHDFTPQLLPETHLKNTLDSFREYFSKTLPISDLVLADSHSTKADAAWLTAADPSRVIVAYPGPSLCDGAHSHRGQVARSQHVGLVVSTLEPRKNAAFLLDWFQRTSVLPAGAELWWVGPTGWLTTRSQLQRMGRVLGDRRVRFLGVVSDARLCRLYRQAVWSIYPSLYEGFGFPVLDSLRHGTPVLTSCNSSLREFQSPGLHFFDPCDPATVDEAWTALQTDGLIEIPTEPLNLLYSWDNVARLILDHHDRSRSRAGAPTAKAA